LSFNENNQLMVDGVNPLFFKNPLSFTECS